MNISNEKKVEGKKLHRPFSRTITRDVTIGLVLVIMVVSILVLSLNYYIATSRARAVLGQKADEYLSYLVQSLELPIWDFNTESVRRIGLSYMNNDLIARLRIEEADGKILFLAEKKRQIDWIDRVGTVVHDGEPVGRIELSLSMQQYKESNRRLILSSLLTIIILLITIVVVTGLLMRVFIRRPIDILIKGIDRMADGQYSQVFDRPKQREIATIISRFEHMAREIQAREHVLNNLNRELAREVQDHKKSELALRESEERYRTVMNASPDPIALCEASGSITYVNPMFTRVLGWMAEDLEGRTIDDLVESNSSGPDRFLKRIVRPEKGLGEEAFAITRSGGRILVSIRASAFLGREGTMQGVVIAMRDTTERKRMEEELRQTRNYLQNVVNSMPSILVGVDEHGRVTQWNVEARRLTGVESKEAVGRDLTDVFPILADRMEQVKSCILSEQPQKTNRIVSNVNGETRIWDMMIYPLVANGVKGAVIRMDDVTARVRIEEMMVQTEKMMSVGGLAAGMAHEINNPLGGILLGAHNISRRLKPDLKKNKDAAEQVGVGLDRIIAYLKIRKIDTFLQGIITSGQRAAQIVTNMLEFSRREESRTVSANMADLLEKTVELAANDYNLKKRFDFRHIDIIREYDPDLPPVPCEPSRIEQVLLNLLKNAAQAMVMDKRPDARSPRIVLRTALINGMVQVEVEDNGPGMDEETRKRIFEPFYTTKGVGEGTGLGLSVSYFIINDNHRGSLAVDSAPGKGARFIIRLPLSDNKGQPI